MLRRRRDHLPLDEDWAGFERQARDAPDYASLVALFARWVTFPVMGRDFEAAVMAGGHCGFGLGATPNAVANMKALVERFGPAPRAFLVVPLVGAFLIDFVNALNITFFLNWLQP